MYNQIHGQNHVVQGQSSQANTLNKSRYRKAVYSALWVQVTLVICYLPYGIAVALTPYRGMPLSTYLAREFTVTLVYLNSSFKEAKLGKEKRVFPETRMKTLSIVKCSDMVCSVYT